MARARRAAALLLLLLTEAGASSTVLLPRGGASGSRALRRPRELQASASASATASTSSSGSGSFLVLPYEGDCPSVRTMVGDCNMSCGGKEVFVTCVIGPAGESGDGSCDEPYAPYDWALSTVSASGMGIEVFESYYELYWDLDLSNNELTEFNPAMVAQIDLHSLDLHGNAITSFNSSGVYYIENLYLSGNSLTDFSYSAELSYYVDVSNNGLVSVNLSEGYELWTLDLSSNRIQSLTLDPNIYVANLYLSNNSMQLFNVTEGLDGLTNLYLQNNAMVTFAPTTDMPKLEILDLSYNQLHTVSLEVYSSLVDLDVSNNQLHVFEACKGVESLYSLKLQNNKLKVFAPASEMPLLEILNLSSNQLSNFSLGPSYPVLSLVDVSNNSLKSIEVSKLSQPHGLFANNNSFSSFGDTINLSENIRSLDLSSNHLTDWAAFNVPAFLMALFASDNGAVTLPHDFSSCDALVFMDFSYNALTHINATLWPSNLQKLDLRGNPIEVFDIQMSDLDKFNNLSKFYVDDFSITTCDEGGELTLLASAEVHVCVYPDSKYLSRVFAELDNARSRERTIMIVSILVGLLFAAAAIVVVALFLRQRRRLNNILLQQELEADPESWPEDIRENASLMAMRIEHSDLKTDKLVRKTHIAEIWRGRFKSHSVTIKRIIEDKACDVAATRAFMDQIRLVDKLEHPRIVQHFGFTWNHLSDLSVVTELLPDESLEGVIGAISRGGKRNCDAKFSWYHCEHQALRSKLEIAIDVAEALVFLHSFSPPIAHRDVRARNVFVDPSGGVKLGEVGLCRSLDEQIGDSAGSIPWMAPELLRDEPTSGGDGGDGSDEMTDVYAFGAFLVELDTCQRPFALPAAHSRSSGAKTGQRAATAVSTASNTQIVLGVSQGELRPPCSDGCPPEVAAIIDDCLQFKPNARPLAMKLHYDLRQLLRAREAAA